MKFSKSLIASAVLLATSSVAFAATDTKSVQINVTQSEFVNIIGTALTNVNTFTSDQMDGSAIALGDLGLDSNLAGNCDVAFSSANGYKLNNAGGATLVDYALTFDGAVVTAAAVTKTCQFTPAALTFASTTALPAANTIAAGTYSDVVSIVVTSI